MSTVPDLHGDRTTTYPAGRAPGAGSGPAAGPSSVVPGLAATAVVAGVANLLGGFLPIVGAPVIAIIGGIVIAAMRPPAAHLKPGISFAAKTVLQGSIVVLGLGLSLGQVLSTGGRSLPVLVGTLAAALGMARLAGRRLRLPTDLRTLIGVGTAVCGASAIAATNAVIEADEADVSYAIATIFTFNVAAVLLYPSIGHALGMSQHTFGLWTGTAVNDLSSVVAASTVYGHAAASYGVIVKLTRTLAIIPICVALLRLRGAGRDVGLREGSGALGVGSGALGVGSGRRRRLWRVFPLFIVVFVAAVISNTLGLVPPGWHGPLSSLATWMITAALAAIGLSTDITRIRRVGARPLLLGALLWLTVGVASLALQAI